MSYYSKIRSFKDVSVTDAGVDTVQFLEASEGLVGLFDILGSVAFSTVKNDLNGNIAKVRTRYDAATDKSKTLEELVKNEQGEKKRTATEGLMWLLRGLKFTCIGLQRSTKDQSEELSVSFTKAYEETLKKHHSIIVRPIFSVAMRACPYRADFYAKLTGTAPLDETKKDLGEWLVALDSIVKRVDTYYEKNGYNKGPF